MRSLIISALLSFFFCFDLFAQNPTLVYPKSNQTISTNKIKLVWDPFVGASSYDVQVSTNIGFFSSEIYSSVLENNLQINTTLFNSYVYWRVKANNSAFSLVDSFFVFRASSVGNCEVWLCPDTLVDYNGVDKIQTIHDLSNNANNAEQTNDARKPLLVNEVLFEKKIINTNGTQDMIFSLPPSANYSFFILASTGSIKNGNECVISSAVAPGARWAIGMGNSAVDGAGWGGASSNILLGNTNHINTNQYYLLNYKKNLSNWDIVVNSNFIRSVPDNSSPSYTGNYFWNIASESGNYAFDGNIGSILIYNQNLSTYSVSIVENYLYDYYAPPVDLGENKTVCSFPLDFTAHQKPYYTSYTWQDGSTISSYSVTMPGTYSVTVTDIFGRQSSDTIIVSQDVASYSAFLGSDRSFCSGDSLFIYAGPKHLQYNWTGGAVENFIKVKTPGTYTVSITDCINNVTSDDIVISENTLPIFSLGGDRTFCFNRDTLLTVSFGFPVTYTWQNNSSNDSILVNQTGTYSLNVIDQNGCKFYDEAMITIDSSLFVMDLGPNLFLCKGNKINLLIGSSQVSSYLWSPTNDITSYTTVNVSGYYYVDVTNFNQCTAKDSVFVTIVGDAPTVDFAFNTTCFGTNTQFSQLSVAPLGNSIISYTWDFGEPPSGSNNTSLLSNPSHHYAADGNFTVSLQVETDIGCTQSTSKEVSVYPLPIADFYSYPACANSLTQFKDFSDGLGFPIAQWDWNFSDSAHPPNTATTAEPLHKFMLNGTYVVSLTVVTQQGCTNSVAKPIYVYPAPNIDFINTPLCAGALVTFTNTSVMPFPQTLQSITWNFGDGQYAFSPTSTHSYTTGNYTASLSINSSVGCTHTVSKTLTVVPYPIANYSYTNNCLNQKTLLADISLAPLSSIQQYKWEFNSTVFSTNATPSYLFNSTGNKNIKLTVANANKCESSVTKTILIKDLPLASFTYTPNFVSPGETITFTNLSQNSNAYVWNFNNGFTSNLFKPITIFSDTGKYLVSLVAKDANECINTISKEIDVLFATLDLGMLSLKAEVTVDNFLALSADLINYGTKPVTDFKLLSSVNSESPVRESWTGELKRGQILPYTFTSSVQLNDADTVNAYVCVKITEINSFKTDDNIDNNELCVSFRADKFMALPGFPNPTKNLYTIPIILPAAEELTIAVFDGLGNLVFSKYTVNANKGLNTIKIETSYLEKGMYFYTISYKDKIVRNKFIVIK